MTRQAPPTSIEAVLVCPMNPDDENRYICGGTGYTGVSAPGVELVEVVVEVAVTLLQAKGRTSKQSAKMPQETSPGSLINREPVSRNADLKLIR